MNKIRLKEILKKQGELFDRAVEDKLRCLMSEDDFNSDIFEKVEQEYMGSQSGWDIFSFSGSEDDLDVIYSHRAKDLAKELPENKIVSYQEKIAALRGISMVEDYYSLEEY